MIFFQEKEKRRENKERKLDVIRPLVFCHRFPGDKERWEKTITTMETKTTTTTPEPKATPAVTTSASQSKPSKGGRKEDKAIDLTMINSRLVFRRRRHRRLSGENRIDGAEGKWKPEIKFVDADGRDKEGKGWRIDVSSRGGERRKNAVEVAKNKDENDNNQTRRGVQNTRWGIGRVR